MPNSHNHNNKLTYRLNGEKGIKMNFRKIAVAAIRAVVTEDMVTEAIYNIVEESDVQNAMEESEYFRDKVYAYLDEAVNEEIESL